MQSSLEIDFLKIVKIIPTLSLEELDNFYKLHPPESSGCRIQQFLNYYFKKYCSETQEKDINNDLEDIHAILPDVPKEHIKCLIEVMDVPNRKEIVVKQLLASDLLKRKFSETTNAENSKKMKDSNNHLTSEASTGLVGFNNEGTVNVSNSAQSIVTSTMKEEEVYQVNSKLISQLMEIFPEASTKYLKELCNAKENNEETLNTLISTILSTDYPRRELREKSPEKELDPEEQYEMLKQILPDADPSYLRLNVDKYINQPQLYSTFLSICLEKKNYPTLKEYLRKQQLSAQARQYTTEFNVQKFLEVIPDPATYFSNKKRKTSPKDIYSDHYVLSFLKNQYPQIQIRVITSIYNTHETLDEVCKKLDSLVSNGHIMRSKRKRSTLGDAGQDIPLLQEIAYLNHRQEIETYIQEKKIVKERFRLEAKQNGLLLTCKCCFDDELLAVDTVHCEKQCVFCKLCVEKSVQIAFGEGKLDFSCLSTCDSFFSLQTLQIVLDPKVFSKLALRKQVEEVKAAGIEDLELCPFCDFATIPPPEDKIFRCLNPDCMKESCRLCKEPSHIPLKCDEIEKDDDVKRRTYVENKMTEALLRKCFKCNRKFIKEDGCNKMTCPCGATMCYVCGQPVKDYKHFNGQGGDKYQLCPLYSDTVELHKNAVLESANKAKMEVNTNSEKEMLIDPTTDILKHFEEMKKKQVPMPNHQLFANNGLVVGRPAPVVIQNGRRIRHRQHNINPNLFGHP